jgi:hypothetical protein
VKFKKLPIGPLYYALMLLGFDGLGLGHIPSKWPWMKSLYRVYWVADSNDVH